MNTTYTFSFLYDNVPDSQIILPIPPSSFKTKLKSSNKTEDIVNIGEINILKKIGLREFSFKILLPKDNTLTILKEAEFKEPIFYLARFREFVANQKPVRFFITRLLPSGKEIFKGNLLVSFEEYSVEENAGEEGDFWVDIKLKEYRKIKNIITNSTGEKDANGNTTVNQTIERATKELAKTYTTVAGDTLWKIAKLQLNDGSRYMEIAELNNITDIDKLLYVLDEGTVLILP
mgnify:CR=1 FL=1